MNRLLALAGWIDRLSERFGRLAAWMVLAACMVSAGNAILRYTIGGGSNAWLEAQWHLFAGMVMLGGARVLRANAHVRVDVIYGRLSSRNQARIDLAGFVLFLLPVCGFLLAQTWPMFLGAWLSDEVSANAGGLPLWPAKMMLPLGFGLLILQGGAEIIKRIAYLRGELAMDLHYEKPLQ
jgi:TRAP-type mannitol/chloroaromatic compound transport system permease small subunit